jgi:hypothetical protein
VRVEWAACWVRSAMSCCSLAETSRWPEDVDHELAKPRLPDSPVDSPWMRTPGCGPLSQMTPVLALASAVPRSQADASVWAEERPVCVSLATALVISVRARTRPRSSCRT